MHPWTAGAWQQLLKYRENLPQALLIYGRPGIGKLDLARRFAQLILCETPGLDQPCGRCDACRWFQAGQHPDFRQIEPESMAPASEAVEDATPRRRAGADPDQVLRRQRSGLSAAARRVPGPLGRPAAGHEDAATDALNACHVPDCD